MILTVTLGACTNPGVIKMGPDTYLISERDLSGIFGNPASFKAEVLQQAHEFAASKGKVVVPVRLDVMPSGPGRFLNIEYQFRNSFIQHAIVQHMAIKDGLTGLFNRSEAIKKLGFLLEYARREQKPISLLLADVDHFKLYNDHYGHLKGDDCLNSIGGALNSCCKRPLDFAARMGGEEFLLVWFDSTPEEESNLSRYVHDAIAAIAIPHKASETDPLVTLSAGYCRVIPGPENTINQLINTVDEALYFSKNSGRNRTKEVSCEQQQSFRETA